MSHVPLRGGAQARSCDRLRGFVHVDSFDELRQWTEDTLDPLCKSNTELLRRPVSTNLNHAGKSKVMLIHDYQGGYNEYEACQGAEVETESYSCDFLRYVETFVYFSHKFVTVPPPTWINTCHRSGVKVLGTFIVEPGAVGVNHILDCERGQFWVANQLVRIAKACGFDGWLVNIETDFGLRQWNIYRLEGFLTQLKAGLGPECQVVWYDALTVFNVVWYQNTLNALNLRFAQAAGSILTNYAWSPDYAEKARILAEESGLGAANVYFGIDVWAQNIQHGNNKRVTYPVAGGGGTGTGLGVKELAKLGLNTGIFAPGWSFEHFHRENRRVERAIWLGQRLPKRLQCNCSPLTPHRDVPYQQHPVSMYAYEFPSGSSSFFHIDFQSVFTKDADFNSTYYAHLGRQSISPRTQRALLRQRSFYGKGIDGVIGSVSLELRSPAGAAIVALTHKHSSISSPAHAQLLLACLGLQTRDDTYEAAIVYRASYPHDFGLSITLSSHQVRVNTLLEDTKGAKKTKCIELDKNTSIDAIMLNVGCGDREEHNNDKVELAEIFSITIQPVSRPRCDIDDIWIEQREEYDSDHQRLVWSINPAPKAEFVRETGTPFSHITGPCAYFRICANGREIGVAYALEFLLPTGIWKNQDEIDIIVAGIAHDGTIMTRSHRTLRMDDDWVVTN